jgi:hypothetical protein
MVNLRLWKLKMRRIHLRQAIIYLLLASCFAVFLFTSSSTISLHLNYDPSASGPPSSGGSGASGSSKGAGAAPSKDNKLAPARREPASADYNLPQQQSRADFIDGLVARNKKDKQSFDSNALDEASLLNGDLEENREAGVVSINIDVDVDQGEVRSRQSRGPNSPSMIKAVKDFGEHSSVASNFTTSLRGGYLSLIKLYFFTF